MYAIVKTGGKQYRVQEGESLLVERLPTADGGSLSLQPLLVVDGTNVVDGDELTSVNVEARVLGHERGPKLRVVKFKPKRGYKRRTGHRQELTRIEVTGITVGARNKPKPVAAGQAATTSRQAATTSRQAATTSRQAATTVAPEDAESTTSEQNDGA